VARPPISLGERLRALAVLAPADAATTAVLHEMLRSHEPQGDVKRAARRAAPKPHPTSSAGAVDSLLGIRDQPAKPLDTSRDEGLPLTPTGTTRVTPVPRRQVALPVLPVPRGLDAGGTVPRREPLPLIAPGKMRAVLAALAAMPSPGSDPDTAALLERIARGLPLDRVPRQPVWSLRRGAQLLVDCSPALMVLAHDIESFERRLQRIVGDARLQRLYFAGCPSRGVGRGERSSWKEWRPAAPGVPVVILTDLGCAGPRGNADWAGPEEWSRFADHSRETGTALVALVPYPVHRVAPSLAQRITVVPWGEALSAARVRRILRDARTVR
jgi:hypothetical protein